MRLLILLVLGVGGLFWGHIHFEGEAADQLAGLEASLEQSQAPVGIRTDLPTLVRDFALAGRREPAEFSRAVRLFHNGSADFRMGGDLASIIAEETLLIGQAGRVLRAERSVASQTLFSRVESYLGQSGGETLRILGSGPLAQEAGPAIDRSQAIGYLTSLPLVPDAILANRDLVWRSVGPDRMAVAISTSDGPVSVEFIFDSAGDIAEAIAVERPVLVGREVRQQDWLAAYGDYGELGGRRIPRRVTFGTLAEGGFQAQFTSQIVTHELVD